MRSALSVILVVLVVGGSFGCRKKTAPQYYDLESRYSVAITRDGDDAYSSAEMDGIVAGLSAIAPDTVEGPKAVTVLERIAAARARLAQEKAEAARAIQPTVAPTFDRDPSPTPTAPPAAAPDAGDPAEPTGGMGIEDFRRIFGLCMTDVGPLDSPGTTEKAHGFTNQDSVICRTRLHLDENSKATYVFTGGRLTERRLERSVLTMVDAGPQPVAAPPPPIQAQYVPGMPAPGGQPPPINGVTDEDAGH
jgi:hypothetical protein